MPVAIAPSPRKSSRTIRLSDRQPIDAPGAFAEAWIPWFRALVERSEPNVPVPAGDNRGRAGIRAMFLSLYAPGGRVRRIGLPSPATCARFPRELAAFARGEGFDADSLQRGRLKIDLVTSWRAPRAGWTRRLPWTLEPRAGVLTDLDGYTCRVQLPDHPQERGETMTPAPDPVVNVWRDQSAAIDAWPSAARFSARTFLETDTCTGVFEVVRARRLLRALGPEDAPLVLARCRAAGRWILRGQGEGGEFLYSQDPVTNRSRGGYNIVRHAGTTMALAQLASRTSDDHFLGGALSGLDFLRGCFRSPEGAPEALYVEFEGVAALGSAALTLLAMLHLPADEWTPSVRAEARALAAFLLNQQRPDGAFVCVYNRSDRVASQNYPSIYYPGEAVLALTRLYAREGDARYLEAAARGARALLRWRPWPASIEELFYENAWLMQALPALYHKTRRKQFRKACFASALRMIRGQWNESNGPAEYAGGLRTVPWLPAAPPATCSTASRTEGLVEAVGLAAATGGPARRLFDATVAAGRFLLEQQFDADTSYFVRSPRDADGCLRESFTVNLTRVDYVQHALSALLGIERLLRQPPLSLEGGG